MRDWSSDVCSSDLEMIRERIDFNKAEGLSKGGTNFANFNVSTKDEFGKFTGSRRR